MEKKLQIKFLVWQIHKPVQQPAVLKNHVWYPHEQCPPPLLGPHWNAVRTDILVTAIYAAHVSVVQSDQLWLFDVDSAVCLAAPTTDCGSWLSSGSIRRNIHRSVVVPSHYSNQALRICLLIIMTSLLFSKDFGGLYWTFSQLVTSDDTSSLDIMFPKMIQQPKRCEVIVHENMIWRLKW